MAVRELNQQEVETVAGGLSLGVSLNLDGLLGTVAGLLGTVTGLVGTVVSTATGLLGGVLGTVTGLLGGLLGVVNVSVSCD